jgi:hypothetical protein
MSYVELDPHTADRILAGVVAPDDSPPGWAHVVRLLDAAALGEQLVEHTARRTVANMAAVIERLRWADEESQGGRVWQGRRRGSAAAVFVAATLTIAVGSAAAATTSPHAVEEFAARMLSGMGVGSSGHDPALPPASTPSHPASKAAEDHGRHRAVAGAQTRHNHAPRNQHGKAVSTVAHTDGLTGRAKGVAVSTVASGGKSHAGQQLGHATSGPPHQPTSDSENSGNRGTSADHAHGVGAQGNGVGKQGKAGS